MTVGLTILLWVRTEQPLRDCGFHYPSISGLGQSSSIVTVDLTVLLWVSLDQNSTIVTVDFSMTVDLTAFFSEICRSRERKRSTVRIHCPWLSSFRSEQLHRDGGVHCPSVSVLGHNSSIVTVEFTVLQSLC